MKHFVIAGLLGLLMLALSLFSGACSDGASNLDGGTEEDGGGDDGGTPSPLLDTTFGENGIAWAHSAWSTDAMYAACRHADGSITLGGTTIDFGHSAQLLFGRFTPSGQPDESFGSGGQVKIPLFDLSRVTALGALADGAVIFVGSAYYVDSVVFAGKLSASGELDESFGDGGLRIWEGDYHAPAAMDVDDQGRVLVLFVGDSGVSLLRLEPDGSTDSSFAPWGGAGGHGIEPRQVEVLPDGKILVMTADYDDSVLHRLNADGGADASFSRVTTDFLAHDFAVSPDGSAILLAGVDETYGNNTLLKVDHAGVPDPGFGTDGLLPVEASGELVVVEWLNSGEIFLVEDSVGNYPDCHFRNVIRLGSDGAPLDFDNTAVRALANEITLHLFHEGSALYLAGGQRVSMDTPAHGDKRMSVVGFAPDGSALPGYGTDGLAQLASLGAPEVMWGMHLRADGSVIASASAGIYGALVRFDQGAHDLSFGDDGFADDYHSQFTKVLADPSGGTAAMSWHGTIIRFGADGTWLQDFAPEMLPGQGRDFGIDASGRYVVAGGVVGGNGTPMLARLLEDGSLDTSFGEGGVVLGFDGKDGFAISVHVDKNGKILTSGEIYPPGDFPYTVVARFNSDGSLDSSFGAGGLLDLDGSNYVSRIIDRAGGGYLIAVQSAFGDVIRVFAVDDAGRLIADFGTEGRAEVEFKRSNLFGILELSDGRILVAKSVQGERYEQMAVRCLTAEGQPDTGFDEDGLFVYPGQGRAVGLLPDGDGVLVGGFHFNAETGTDLVLLRIEP